jgi:hypothetical protein
MEILNNPEFKFIETFQIDMIENDGQFYNITNKVITFLVSVHRNISDRHD